MSALIQAFASMRLATLASSACLSAGAHLLARNNAFSADRDQNEAGKVLFDYPLSVTAGAIALSILGTGIAGTAVFASFCLLPLTFKATLLVIRLSEIRGNPYPRLNQAARHLNDVARLISKVVNTAGCIYLVAAPLAGTMMPLASANNPIANIFVTALMLDKPETVLWPLAGACFMVIDLFSDLNQCVSAAFSRAVHRA